MSEIDQGGQAMTQPTEQDRPMSAIAAITESFECQWPLLSESTVRVDYKEWQEVLAEHSALQARVAELEAEKWNAQIAEAGLLSVEKERDGLLSQLPEGMKHCTIIFKECDKGHGWLTATNWVQHGCPKCEFDRIVDEKHELQRLQQQSSKLVSALHLEACQWRIKAEKAEQERDGLAAKCAELESSLTDAATSLNTISIQAGKEPFMQSMVEVRSYARSRAMCAGYKNANQIEREGGV